MARRAEGRLRLALVTDTSRRGESQTKGRGGPAGCTEGAQLVRGDQVKAPLRETASERESERG